MHESRSAMTLLSGLNYELKQHCLFSFSFRKKKDKPDEIEFDLESIKEILKRAKWLAERSII